MITQSLKSMCRLCTRIGPSSKFSNVFTKQDIMLKLQNILKIDMLENDNFPKQICSGCLERIVTICETVDMCIKSHEKLCNLMKLKADEQIQLAMFEENHDQTLQDLNVSLSAAEVWAFMNNSAVEVEQTLSDNFLARTAQENIVCDSTQYCSADLSGKEHVLFIQFGLSNTVADEHSVNKSFEATGKENQVTLFLRQSEIQEETIDTISSALTNDVSPIQEECEYFDCEKCKFKFDESDELDEHMLFHKQLSPFVCKICGKTFRYIKEHKKHIKNHSEDDKITHCSICNLKFNDFWVYKRHQRLNHLDITAAKRKFICQICGKCLSNLNSLRVHIHNHNTTSVYSCDKCGKSFKQPYLLKSHQVSHNKHIRNFKCDTCFKEFHSKQILKQHLITHSPIKKHVCIVCKKSFNRLGNMKEHFKKHKLRDDSTAMELICKDCSKTFKSQIELHIHNLKHSQRNKDSYSCSICEKNFTQWCGFKTHALQHMGVTPFHCTVCNKAFTSLQILKQHSIIHEDRYPYPCNICSKKFKRQQSLIIHKKTHTGEKKYMCGVCKRCFLQKGDMKKHQKTHLPKNEMQQYSIENIPSTFGSKVELDLSLE